MQDLGSQAQKKRSQKSPKARVSGASDAIGKGFAYLARIQSEDGGFHGDYGGPLFLVPGYVFAHYATNTPLPPKVARGLQRYIESVQNADGGFGLHIESKSYLFTTVLNYVALRLLGVAADAPAASKACAWIRRQPGGALGVPSWGKFWLCVLGLYEYEGINPVLPELWLLPASLPIHPSQMWCHARAVYLPMAYLYGRRWRVPESKLLEDVRAEIYAEPYGSIRWREARSYVLPSDVYTPHSFALGIVNRVLDTVEQGIGKIQALAGLRRRALSEVLDHVKHEQLTTNFVDLGPVNKALDTIACYAAEPDSAHTKRAIAALPEYLFLGEDGLKMQGYHSSELWDTAFVLQALGASGRAEEFRPLCEKAYAFVDRAQIRADVPERERYYRDPTKGGWGFSNAVNGWPVFDCTADALKVAIEFAGMAKAPIAKERLFDAVDLLLFGQNPGGGWASYEKRRASPLLELINPSEVFGRIMTEYPYVELTASAMMGLLEARKRFGEELGGERLARIAEALKGGDRFLRRIQRQDGSFEGSWAVCFTYGTWFGVSGLVENGASADDPAIDKAVAFLLSKQLPDGGWGESYLSCQLREYVHHPDGSQVVMTAWALLALLRARAAGKAGDHELDRAIDRGVALLEERQKDDGDWPKEGIAGVFNRTCMIHYRFYRNYFPLWALALAEQAEGAR